MYARHARCHSDHHCGVSWQRSDSDVAGSRPTLCGSKVHTNSLNNLYKQAWYAWLERLYKQ